MPFLRNTIKTLLIWKKSQKEKPTKESSYSVPCGVLVVLLEEEKMASEHRKSSQTFSRTIKIKLDSQMKRAPLSLTITIIQRLMIGRDGMIRLRSMNIQRMKISFSQRFWCTVSKHVGYNNFASTMSTEESLRCLLVTQELVKQLLSRTSSITQTRST